MSDFDVIVVGLGAAGSATVRALATRGVRVLGIDQFDPPHALGSSHGDTRITRLAVGEGQQYGVLARRSHEIWRALEFETGERLLEQCGGLILGVRGATGQHNVDDFVGATIANAERDHVAHEILDAGEIVRRYPALGVTTETGYFEPTAGYLRPEACVRALLTSARTHGATLLTNETVHRWNALDGVQVETDQGRYRADALVLCAGPWMADLVPWFAPAFAVYRQVQHWFAIDGDLDALAALPVYIWMHSTLPGEYFYGFPAINGRDGGVKVATEQYVATTTADDVDRVVTDAETADLYERCVRGRLRGVGPISVSRRACLYTVTPDFGFLVDAHPGFARVYVVSACSGHGFKHSAAVGEAAAAWTTTGTRPASLDTFSFGRF